MHIFNYYQLKTFQMQKYIFFSKNTLLSPYALLFDVELILNLNFQDILTSLRKDHYEGIIFDDNEINTENLKDLLQQLKSEEFQNLKVAIFFHNLTDLSYFKLFNEELNVKWILPSTNNEKATEAFLRAYFLNSIEIAQIAPSSLFANYKKNLLQKIEMISALIRKFEERNSVVILQELNAELNKISESAPSYSFESVGSVCNNFEQYLAVILKNKDVYNSEQVMNCCKNFLNELLLGYQHIQFTPLPYYNTKANHLSKSTRNLVQNSSTAFIYLVTSDVVFAQQLQNIQRVLPVQIVIETNPVTALEMLTQRKIIPQAIIYDDFFPVFRIKGEEILTAAKKQQSQNLFAAEITECKNIQKALQNHVNGCSFIFQKPISNDDIETFFQKLFVTKSPLKANLLVIDDNQKDTQYIEKALQGEGFEILTANNAKDAFLALESYYPDIVIIDPNISLDAYTGWNLIELLRRSSHYNDLIIVIFTTANQTATLTKGFDVGADVVLFKPLESTSFVKQINFLVDRYKSKDILRSIEPLTGFYTKVKFLVELRSYFNTKNMGGSNSAIIFIHYKGLAESLNEYQEHLQELKRNLAVLTKKHFTKSLLACSFDPNTFALLIIDTSQGELEFEFDSFVKGYKEEVLPQIAGNLQVRLTVGCCLFKLDQVSCDQVLELAQQVLQEYLFRKIYLL